MVNPYAGLPESAFWRSAVADRSPFDIDALWRPKFTIDRSDAVITAGSCFAQHIGMALSAADFSWMDAEIAPASVPKALQRKYNYGIFSFRTSNIYTAALLRQWFAWALLDAPVPGEVWHSGDRCIDPFRPTIEPGGFASVAELEASRATTLRAIRSAIERASVFIFTMGLTESWEHRSGHVYPMCPGTTAGEFDGDQHLFRNHDYVRVKEDMVAAIELARRINPTLRVLLTVSPVPLTATASGAHVLSATTYSKSTLRAVAGDLAAAYPWVDYFPSYEIISGHPFRGFFFEPNLRSVAADGVAFVMRSFFSGLGVSGASLAKKPPTAEKRGQQKARRRLRDGAPPASDPEDADRLVCEEEMLDQAR